MNYLEEAFAALLECQTTKTGNEINWEDQNGNPITVEPIDIATEKYIVRLYYESGQLWLEKEYKNDKRHGISKNWYENGQLLYEYKYKNGLRHGISKNWYENGQLKWEEEYQNGQLIK